MASADSVLRVNQRSAEVNSRHAEKIVSHPALRHLSREFNPDKYIQKHDSRFQFFPAKPLFAIRGVKTGASRPGIRIKYTDIAIIGGGLAGSTAVAMLGRAGISTVLIDPHQVYPFDLRVEKSAATSSSVASTRPESPIRCSAQPPMTTKTGSRDSAICSTRSRAANTASCRTR